MRHRSTCRNFALLVVFLGGISYMLQGAADREFSKLIEETFELRAGGQVSIDNQYGRVEVTTWDREEVQISVRVTTQAKSASKGEETLKRIDVDFSSSSSHVHAGTEIRTNKSVWWFIQDWLGEADISIDYEVRMPRVADLEIDHKYGRVDVGEIDGDVTINLKNGDVEVDQVTGKLRLDLSHGYGVIAKANETDAELNFYKLRVNDANIMEVDARFSRINVHSANDLEIRATNTKNFLGDIGTLDLENKYGSIEIDRVEEARIIADHCDTEIDVLSVGIDGDISYGDLWVDQVGTGLEYALIEGENAGVNLDLSNLEGYGLSVDGDFTTLDVPEEVQRQTEKTREDDVSIKGSFGLVGSKARIEVILEHSGLKIQ